MTLDITKEYHAGPIMVWFDGDNDSWLFTLHLEKSITIEISEQDAYELIRSIRCGD